MSQNSQQPPGDMPPLPRDHASSLMSEIIPIRSRTTKFWKSRLFWPGVAAVLVMVALFVFQTPTRQVAWLYALILGMFILFGIFMAFYAYSGSQKPLWAFLFPFAFMALGLIPPFNLIVQLPFELLFRGILPGRVDMTNATFPQAFVGMFFGAGMMEEIMKILAVMIMVGIGIKARAQGVPRNQGFMGGLAAITPLDCMLAGMASGAGFIASETFLQYYDKSFERGLAATKDEWAGVFMALQNSIPRSLNGLVGHMAWSGIFGYFLGLGLRHARLSTPLFVGGWILVAAMHGFWNSGALSPLGAFAWVLSGLTTLIVLISCLLKAKQMEPASTPAEGSIVVGSAMPGMAAHPAAPRTQMPVAPAQAKTSAPPAADGFVEARPIPPPAPPPVAGPAVTPLSVPPGAAPAGYRLDIGGLAVPLYRNVKLDLARTPGLERLGQGFFAEVSAHPNNPAMLGLKNLGATPWIVISAAGQSQEVPPLRSARLEEGARIRHGEVTLVIAAHR